MDNNAKYSFNLHEFIKLFCSEKNANCCFEVFIQLLNRIGFSVSSKGKTVCFNFNDGASIELSLESETTAPKTLLKSVDYKPRKGREGEPYSRTKHDKIRENIFYLICEDNFKAVNILATELKNYYVLNDNHNKYIQAFSKNGFVAEKDKKNLELFIGGIENDSDRVAWIFAFLCFPIENYGINEFNRSKLLNRVIENKKIYLPNLDKKNIIIAGNKVPKNKINIGRDDVVHDIKEELLANTAVLLYGIGGIGKTHICRRLFYDFLNCSSNKIKYLIWVQYSVNLNCSLLDAFADEKINTDYNYESNSSVEPLLSKLRFEKDNNNKIKIIEKIIDNIGTSLLIIIDNANNISREELNRLKVFNCHIVINSRKKMDDILSIQIKELAPKECCSLYKKECGKSENYSSYANEKIINQIVKQVGYHTLSIVLIARARNRLLKTDDNMLEELKARGVVFKGISTKITIDGDERSILEHLSKIFDITVFSNDKTLKILRYFSLLEPNSWIKISVIEEWFGINNVDDDSLYKLVDSAWLSTDNDNPGYISMPLVISDVIRFKYPPDYTYSEPLIEAMNKKIESIESYYDNEEIVKHHKAVIDRFGDLQEPSYTSLIFSDLHTLSITLPNNEAIEYYYKLFRIIEWDKKDTREPFKNEILEGLYEYLTGDIEYLQYNYILAVDHYEKAIKLLTSHLKPITKTIVNIHNRLATCYNEIIINYNWAKILNYKSIDLNIDNQSQQYSIYCNYCSFMSLKHLKENLQIFIQLYGKNNLFVFRLLQDMAFTYILASEYDSAKGCLNTSKDIIKNIYARLPVEAFSMINHLENIILYKQGEIDLRQYLDYCCEIYSNSNQLDDLFFAYVINLSKDDSLVENEAIKRLEKDSTLVEAIWKEDSLDYNEKIKKIKKIFRLD